MRQRRHVAMLAYALILFIYDYGCRCLMRVRVRFIRRDAAAMLRHAAQRCCADMMRGVSRFSYVYFRCAMPLMIFEPFTAPL